MEASSTTTRSWGRGCPLTSAEINRPNFRLKQPMERHRTSRMHKFRANCFLQFHPIRLPPVLTALGERLLFPLVPSGRYLYLGLPEDEKQA